MKKIRLTSFILASILTSSLFLGVQNVQAEPESAVNSGTVSVVDGGSVPVDPENPITPVDPGGDSPSTKGTLRIDYVSALDFGVAEIKKTNRVYSALAQQFRTDIGARGSYIQITDQRTESTGWTLQVKQETQFKNRVIQNTAEQELLGAVMSLDKGWANSSSTSNTPTVTRNTIALSPGSASQVATATAGSGRGVWTISFGASKTNTSKQENTLSPVIDANGKAVMDSVYQKPAYSNSAITLSVPDSTKIYPVQYETEITWILSELP